MNRDGLGQFGLLLGIGFLVVAIFLEGFENFALPGTIIVLVSLFLAGS